MFIDNLIERNIRSIHYEIFTTQSKFFCLIFRIAFFFAIRCSSLLEVKNLRLRCSDNTFDLVTFFRNRRINCEKDSLSRFFTFTNLIHLLGITRD